MIDKVLFTDKKEPVVGFVIVLILSSVVNIAYGQVTDMTTPVKFGISAPTDTFAIGDEITIKIQAEYPESLKLTPPSGEFADSAFTLKAGPKIESQSRNNKKYDTFTFTLMPFETGEFQTPAFEFYWFDSAGKSHSIIAPQRPVYVKSLLPADTSGVDIKDIIGPKALPTRWWPYVLAGFILIAIAAAWYFLFRRKLQKMEIPSAPPEPPFDRAVRELALLKEKDLLGKGKIKQFYIELSDILRRYIEGRYEIAAVEATTYELKRVLRHPELPSEKTQEILTFLGRADLVKFAKFTPTPEFPENDYEFVRGFIIATKPIEIAVEAVKEAAG